MVVNTNNINDKEGDAAYNQYVNSTDVPNDQIINAIFLERKTEHAEDAIDYEDIDELADDEDDLPMEEVSNGERILLQHTRDEHDDFNDDYEDDEFSKLFQEGNQKLKHHHKSNCNKSRNNRITMNMMIWQHKKLLMINLMQFLVLVMISMNMNCIMMFYSMTWVMGTI